MDEFRELGRKVINLQGMIQFEDKRDDIYQILSFCLGYLKRKILLLLKIFLSDKSPAPSAQLVTELAKQQSSCQESIALLKGNSSLINKNDEILYQRFVCRIKQLVRNYLPHASLSHELFVFLKKIETYSFKSNYQFEDYILYILVQNPPTLTQIINHQIQSLKTNDSLKRNSPRRHDQFNPDEAFTRLSPSRQFKKLSFNASNFKSDLQSDYQSTKPTEIDNNRPIDIFNKNIQPIMDCLNCDISIIRGVYFNMQKEKESTFFCRNFSQTFTITKTVREISDQMLDQNRFIKDSISYYDKQYARYSLRLENQPDFYKKQRKHCQTANGTRRKHNFSILPDHPSDNFPKTKPLSQTKNKFETINYQTEQQRQELYREMQKRKNTVLKMKSISISANKGHLELCSQTRDQSKKLSLTFSNLKKVVSKNNCRNVAVNLKKKYEIFMSNFSETTVNQPVKKSQNHKTLTISTQKPSKVFSTLAQGEKIDWIEQSPINLKKHEQFDIEVTLSPHLTIKNKETIISDYLEPHEKNMMLRRQIHSRLSEDRNQLSQTMGKNRKVEHDFQNTIKNVMKGGNVNHRNYANHQYRDKRIFETLNPELTVKTIRKT